MRPKGRRFLFADRKGLGMLVLRSAAITLPLLMMSASGFGQSQGRSPIAPEYQDMVDKRAKEREKIAGC